MMMGSRMACAQGAKAFDGACEVHELRCHQLAAVVFALGLAACGDKTTETLSGPVAVQSTGTTNPMTKGPVIIMLGDSLTAGYQLASGAALPAALQHVYDDRGIPAKFVNAGVSGDTPADG